MAIGTKKIEDFVPIVKYNEGIYSALAITTTGNLTVGGDLAVTGDITLDDITLDALTVTGNSLLGNAATDTLGVTGLTTFTSAGAGTSVTITSSATTGDGLAVVASSLTTGEALSVLSNSADTGTRSLIAITNDNVAATGTTPLTIVQDAPTSTNFKKIADFGGIGVYISDQTSPNGALTAAEGSICLNASATGQIAYNNDGATSWQIITSA